MLFGISFFNLETAHLSPTILLKKSKRNYIVPIGVLVPEPNACLLFHLFEGK